MRTVCVKVEQKNNKRSNWTWLEGLRTMKNFLEEGKLVVGDASVVCVVPHCYPLLKIFGIMQEYYSLVPRPRPAFRRFQYRKVGEGLE